MASSNGYPKVTSKAWKALRARASAAPTTKFTPATVAALMGMSSPKSAMNNTVYPMRVIGLIDEDGALTARGNKWRSDGTYGQACDEIVDEIYPDELSAFADDAGKPDALQVRTWFEHKGFGDSNARQMAATYVMIASKEVPEAVAAEPRKTAKQTAPAKKAAAKVPAPKREAETPPPVTDREPRDGKQSNGGPSVHLDIQIHIPADATADQIDRIFASMAKHLYNK